MAFESVDKLQKVLATDVFNHTKDPKKAAGRALGTLVEIITYYLLKTWGLNNQISIERGLEEYGNPNISHNVEYSLHPIIQSTTLTIERTDKAITSNKILKALVTAEYNLDGFTEKSNQLLNKGILRNACTIATSEDKYLLCSIKNITPEQIELHVYEQSRKPYAMFECKRVVVEEGMIKGLVLEMAYDALVVSNIQKIINEKGEQQGIAFKKDGTYTIKPIEDLKADVIELEDKELLKRYVMTIAVISYSRYPMKNTEIDEEDFNHQDIQKEIKMLAKSYDWLLSVTDQGLLEFVEKFILVPQNGDYFLRNLLLSENEKAHIEKRPLQDWMSTEIDKRLTDFFSENPQKIESWFYVMAPAKKLSELKRDLGKLQNKNWESIHLN